MKWLAQYATRVAVRRVVTILVLALLAWVGIGRAEASVCGLPSLGEAAVAAGRDQTYQTQSEAGAACSGMPGEVYLSSSGGANVYTFVGCRVDGNELSADYESAGRILWPPNCTESPRQAGVPSGTRGWKFLEACPPGTEWNGSTCFDPSDCLSHAPLKGVRSPGMSGTVCSGGCQFTPDGVGLTAAFGGGDPMTVAPGGWKPSGAACTPGDPAPEPIPEEGVCTPLGANQTACMEESGRHCHITPSGKRFCWQPGEVGEKADGPDLQRTDPGETPQTPNPPESGDPLIPEGQPVTTEITQNGRKTTTTTTSYSTQHGTNAGTGPGQAEGGGTGTGNGGGNGDGDGDGDDDAGGVGDGVGDLYEGSGKTVEGVVGDFVERMGNAGIIAAAGNFMGNCNFSGNCPVWTWDGGDYAGTMTFDQLCSGALSSLLQYGGWIVLALGAFAAFRIAVY